MANKSINITDNDWFDLSSLRFESLSDSELSQLMTERIEDASEDARETLLRLISGRKREGTIEYSVKIEILRKP